MWKCVCVCDEWVFLETYDSCQCQGGSRMSVMFVFESNWIVMLVHSFANTQIQPPGAIKKHTPH